VDIVEEKEGEMVLKEYRGHSTNTKGGESSIAASLKGEVRWNGEGVGIVEEGEREREIERDREGTGHHISVLLSQHGIGMHVLISQCWWSSGECLHRAIAVLYDFFWDTFWSHTCSETAVK
jgi:hypothetical protein